MKASAGIALVGLAYSWARPISRAEPRPLAAARRVLIQDIRLGPTDLSAGSLSGVGLTDAGLTLAPGVGRGEYVSPVLAADFPFTHVGVHWSGRYPQGSSVSFWMRTSADGLAWGPWETVLVEAFPGEAANDETYGGLIAADRDNYVQFRSRLQEGSAKPTLNYVTVTLLNALDGPPLAAASTSSASVTAAATAKPITFTREDWGADESLGFWEPSYVPTKKIIVHHTVTRNTYSDTEAAKADVRAIYTYHTVSLGWGDIGYNALVDRFGNSYEGRRGREGPGYDGPGGREILSEDVVAGHASHHNHGGTGIALLGTFCSTSECSSGTSPSSAMVQRLRDLLVWECRRHRINPQAVSDFLRSDDAWRRNMANLSGHRDVFATICPGANVYALLPSLRDYVAAQRANSQTPTVTITSFPAEGTVSDAKADYVWRGAGGTSPLQFSHYLEGWSKSSEGINYLKGYTADRSPAWSSWGTGTEAHFTGLAPGHYTFHVRARDSQGRVSVYQDNRTFLQTGTPPDTPFRSFVPGVAKDSPR